MRASLRPQKRDHISAFNTRTNRKVLHLRKCAEALLKELENKKSDENNEDVNNNDNDFSKRRTRVKFLAAEVALKAIRRAREGDLPRKLIDQQNYCLRCGFPLHKEEDKEEEDQRKKSKTNENNNSDNNRRMNCSCCRYKLSSSIHAKKKKKKKKRRIL